MDKSLQGKLWASRVYPEFFPIGKDENVLHAGCGGGAQILAYATKARIDAKEQTHAQTQKSSVGRIACIDVQEERVALALANAKDVGIENIEGCVADLEKLLFPDTTFEKIVAVDIIQHVHSPEKVFAEFLRILKPDGELLITFPALQHYWLTKISKWKQEKTSKESSSTHSEQTSSYSQSPKAVWDPDQCNHNLPLSKWLRIGDRSGFRLIRSGATTLFPPLHRYGIPRFWFSNDFVHRIDYFLGGFPVLKLCGQAMMCVYRKS